MRSVSALGRDFLELVLGQVGEVGWVGGSHCCRFLIKLSYKDLDGGLWMRRRSLSPRRVTCLYIPSHLRVCIIVRQHHVTKRAQAAGKRTPTAIQCRSNMLPRLICYSIRRIPSPWRISHVSLLTSWHRRWSRSRERSDVKSWARALTRFTNSRVATRRCSQ